MLRCATRQRYTASRGQGAPRACFVALSCTECSDADPIRDRRSHATIRDRWYGTDNADIPSAPSAPSAEDPTPSSVQAGQYLPGRGPGTEREPGIPARGTDYLLRHLGQFPLGFYLLASDLGSSSFDRKRGLSLLACLLNSRDHLAQAVNEELHFRELPRREHRGGQQFAVLYRAPGRVKPERCRHRLLEFLRDVLNDSQNTLRREIALGQSITHGRCDDFVRLANVIRFLRDRCSRFDRRSLDRVRSLFGSGQTLGVGIDAREEILTGHTAGFPIGNHAPDHLQPTGDERTLH